VTGVELCPAVWYDITNNEVNEPVVKTGRPKLSDTSHTTLQLKGIEQRYF